MPDSALLQAPVSIEGNIDRVDNKVMQLWCRDVTAPGRAVLVDVQVNDRLFGRFVASEYRPDLEAAGKGTGHHGLTVDLNGSQMVSADGALSITVCAVDTPGQPFASIELRPTVADNLELSPAIVLHLQKHLPRLVEDLHERGRTGWGVSNTPWMGDRVAAPIVQPVALAGLAARKVAISKVRRFCAAAFPG